MEGGGRRGSWKKTRSTVWDHFTRHTGDDGKKRSKCNRCGKEYAYGHGTSNMLEHLKECGGDQGQESAHVGAGAAEQQPQPIPSLPPEDEDMQGDLPLPPPCASSRDRGAVEASEHPTPGLEEQAHPHGPGLDDDDEEEARRDLARMIVLDGHHPSVVEDAHFKSFVRRLNPRFKVPSREDIEKVCDTVLAESWGNLTYDPGHAPGAHSFAVGKAKSIEAWEALYITRNFIDGEWNLHRLVDRAYMVLPPGNRHDASASLLGVPVVSRENAAERVVSYILPQLGHYPHMVAGEMTSGIVGHLELKRLMDQKLGSTDIDAIFCTTNMDLVLHSIGHCLLQILHHAELIFFGVLTSLWTRQNRQKRLSELGLDDPLEFDERWYWYYCCFKIESFVIPSLQRILCNIWGTIYSAIKRISASSTPTSHLCLEELLKVRDALQSQLSAPSLQAYYLRTATLKIVDRAIEDSYLVWSLPLVLDPRYKLRHIEEKFHKAFDDSKATTYTLDVRRMVRVLYTRYTKNLDDNSDEEMIAADSTSSSDQARDKQCHSQNDSHVATKTELDDYLDDSPARTTKGFDFDILNWWKVYGSVQYPTVARMARAALAMPTCSKLTSDQTAHVKSIIRGYKKNPIGK